MGGEAEAGTPAFTVEPSGSVVGLTQQNTGEGRCSLENPREMLTFAPFWLLYNIDVCCPVIWLEGTVLV